MEVAEDHASLEQTEKHEVYFFLPSEDSTADRETDAYPQALIFYPGGKVQTEAYAPLCSQLAERGILCALVEMPFHLAVLDINAASDVMDYMSEHYACENYYIGGHSLGGAMASYYAYSETESLQGLVLMGAYCDKDLSQSRLRVLSIYGSQDQILSRDKYEEGLAYMPADFTEVLLQGGCHSYYGCYGLQKGDGNPSISNEEQISETADAIAEWMQDQR